MSWQELNAMLKRARAILRKYPDSMVFIDIRIFDKDAPTGPEHWTMEANEENGDNRLRIGVTRRRV